MLLERRRRCQRCRFDAFLHDRIMHEIDQELRILALYIKLVMLQNQFDLKVQCVSRLILQYIIAHTFP